ncbi:alpha/beta hydrolases superfamily protein [Tanacetum coccineum]
MVVMVTSLLVLCLPVLVGVCDVVVMWGLLTRFSCLSCVGVMESFRRYEFRRSLIDVPLVSVVRSLIITCVYMICDGPMISHGQYLGTVTLCSAFSVLLLSVKVCIFTVNSQLEAEASSSPTRQRLHLKKSWGMACYCFVLSSKHLFSSGYAKVPRSPTPTAGRTPKSDSEIRRKPLGQGRNDGELPVRLLADVDSLFMDWPGVTLHYKLSMPSPPSRTLSYTLSLHERPSLNVISKTQYHLRRSFSNQMHNSPLYAPLLDGTASEEIPVFSLDEVSDENVSSKTVSHSLEQVPEVNGQFGIILVHGFGGGVFSWRHVMGVLSRQVNCIVAAFDRPGWGLTSRPRREEWEANNLPNPYMLDTQVDMLISFCKEMGLSSVVLVGHDDGGLLALKAAQKVKASPGFADLVKKVVPGFAKHMNAYHYRKEHMSPLLRTEISQVVNRRAWYDATKLTTDVLSLYKAPLCVEGWDDALHEINRLSSETVLTQQNESLLVKAVDDTPLLVIAGAEDALVPLRYVQAMASKFVNSRLVAISGCGHLPHEECPKAFLAAVLPFISKLSSGMLGKNILDCPGQDPKISGTTAINMERLLMFTSQGNSQRYASKRLGTVFNHASANVFNQFIRDAQLWDIPLGGHLFTRINKHGDKLSKLDRFLTSDSFAPLLQKFSGQVLDCHISDHRPILLSPVSVDFGPTPFKFYNSWLLDKNLHSTISDFWENFAPTNCANPIISFKNKMKALKIVIKDWSLNRKDSQNREKEDLNKKIKDFDASIATRYADLSVDAQRSSCIDSLRAIELKENMDFSQKAKIKWGIEADENSKFFHAIVNQKRRYLSIQGIKIEGHWIEDPLGIKDAFLTFYEQKFQKVEVKLRLEMLFGIVGQTNHQDQMVSPLPSTKISGMLCTSWGLANLGSNGFWVVCIPPHFLRFESMAVPLVKFNIHRGLCHGVPLFSFSLIIAMEGLHVAMEDARLVAISGCGHLPHEECPKAFLAAVLPFISKLLIPVDCESH